jgi:antirestriction protein ArdC
MRGGRQPKLRPGCLGVPETGGHVDGGAEGNAGYIATWIDLLKADKRAFFIACNRASKAVKLQATERRRERTIAQRAMDPT